MMIALLPLAVSFGGLAFSVLPMVGSILLAYGIYQVIVETRHGEKKRLADRLQGRGTSSSEKRSTDSILRRIHGEEDTGFLGGIVSKFAITPKIQTLLDQANVNWSASKMLVNQGALAVVAFLLIIVLQYSPLAALGVAIGILVLPLMWISRLRANRITKLTMQLPDVFEIMSQALRAGHSLASAMEVIHDQLPEPAGAEFGRVFHEQNLGIKIEDALTSMANRVDTMDVRFFVTAVLIQRQTGGDLAEVLDKISSVIRDRIELFGLVASLTAEGRLSGWVLLALPSVVFAAVMLLNPNYGDTLLEDESGKVMLMIAAGMQVMGLAMIRWIVNIKV